MPVFGERIELLAKERGFRSQEDLLAAVQAHQPSMAASSLSQIKNDRRSPRLDNLEAIAHALGTTVAYLIGEVDDPAPQLGASEPLPAVRVWSERLKAMEAGQRALTIRAMEATLAAVEGRN